MFNVGELGATINADRSPFDRTLDNVFRDGGRRMQQLGTTMTAALTAPLVGAGAIALKTAADYESLRQSMDILNGSAEEGARNFERLKEFSAGTPFQLQDLARAQNMLQGFGMSADSAFESMSMIGDIAAVTGGDIQGIGIAFGQAAAEGRLMTRDIRQLINQGVPAIQLLADTMGVAQSEVFDLASEGEISFEILQQAFRDATEAGGMFANGMEKQSQTLKGLFSTMKDNASIALAEIGNSLEEAFSIKELMRGFIDGIKSATSWFSSLSQEGKQLTFIISGITAAIGPVSLALGTLMRILPTVIAGFTKLKAVLSANPFYAIGAAIAFVGTRAVVARKSMNALKESIDSTIDAGDDLGEVNDRIAEIGQVFSDAAEQSETMPGVDADDIVDPELQAELNQLIELQRRLSSEKLEMQMEAESVNRLSDFMQLMDINFASVQETANNFDMSTPFIEAQKPMADMITGMKTFKTDLQGIDSIIEGVTTSVPDKYFPPGSLGSLEQKLQRLEEKLRIATHPADISQLSEAIKETRNEINNFGDDAEDSGKNAAMAMGGLGNALGGVIGNLIRGRKEALSFGNILASVAPALLNVLTGGSGGFISSLASGLFGGFRSNGGPAFAGQAYRVGERNQPEMFVPSTNGSIQPMASSSGMPKRMQVNISGTLTGQGSELRAVINESQHIDLS